MLLEKWERIAQWKWNEGNFQVIILDVLITYLSLKDYKKLERKIDPVLLR